MIPTCCPDVKVFGAYSVSTIIEKCSFFEIRRENCSHPYQPFRPATDNALSAQCLSLRIPPHRAATGTCKGENASRRPFKKIRFYMIANKQGTQAISFSSDYSTVGRCAPCTTGLLIVGGFQPTDGMKRLSGYGIQAGTQS